MSILELQEFIGVIQHRTTVRMPNNYIIKDQYHRLLKGEEDLVLRIENGT